MKKTLSLKDTMRSLHVIETDEGIELQSAAGTAKYDAWGARREVNGIPEYFPSSVTVNKRPPAPVDDKGPSVPDDSCAPLVRTMKLRVELDTSGAQRAVDELDDKIRSSDAFKVLSGGWSFEKNGTLIINNGQVLVTDSMIGDGMLSTNYSVKINVDHNGKQYASGMSIGVNDTATELRLSDQMQEAILKIVRDSDLFKSLVNSLDAQVASIAGLQQAIPDAVNEAIRNALKPGGLLWSARSRGI